MSLRNVSSRWLALTGCLVGLAALGGCASAVNIGIPTGEPIAAAQARAESERTAAAEAGRPVSLTGEPGAVAVAPAAPQTAKNTADARPAAVVAQGDAEEGTSAASGDAGQGVLPWPSINRWPADQNGSGLLTTEEADATRLSLQERAAAQIRQTLELMSLRRQREAAKEVIADAVQRTKDVLSGIDNKCRTGQADESCNDETGKALGAAGSNN